MNINLISRGILFLTAILFQVSLNGQLSGSFTIDPSSSASSSNYLTIASLLEDLTLGSRSDGGATNGPGVSAAVTVTVAAGVTLTHTQPTVISPISGVSATNTITLDGNGSTIEYSPVSSNARVAIFMSGIEYFTLKNFTVDMTGGEYGWGIVFINSANYNTVSGMEILCPDVATSMNRMGIIFSQFATSLSGGDNGSYNLIENNTIRNGNWGIAIAGTANDNNPGNKFIGNKILDSYVEGVYVKDQIHDLLIEGNEISWPNKTGGTTYRGIYVYGGGSKFTSAKGIRVRRNKIHTTSLSPAMPALYKGIYFDAVSSLSGMRSEIVNNLLYDVNHPTSSYDAVYIRDSDSILIAHNTIQYQVKSRGSKSQTTSVRAYYLYDATNLLIYNNMFYAIGQAPNTNIAAATFEDPTGGLVSINSPATETIYHYYESGTVTFKADYNNFYVEQVGGGNKYWHYASPTRRSLSSWKFYSGQDWNSTELDPEFYDYAQKDFRPTNPDLLKSCPNFNINVDLTNQPRGAMVDPGALEFSATNDLILKRFVDPHNSCSYGTNEDVTIEIYNAGVNSQTGFLVDFILDGGTPVVENVGTYTIAQGETKSYTFTAKVDLSAKKAYNIISNIYLATDENIDNNSDTLDFEHSPNLTVNAGSDVTICKGSSVVLGGSPTATGGKNGPYLYKWQPSSNVLDSTASNPTAVTSATTNFTVFVYDQTADCIEEDEVTVNVSSDEAPTLNMGANPLIACGKNAIKIGGSPLISGGNPPINFYWRPGATLDDSTAQNPMANPNSYEEYTLFVNDNKGCKTEGRVEVFKQFSGTYSVGTSSSDFPDFTTAFSSLESQGVCGPVILDYKPGSTMLTENFVIPRIPGISTTNTVTIEGNNNTIYHAGIGGGSYAGIKFENASYITIQNLIYDASSLNVAYGILFTLGSDSNTVKNSIINLNLNSTQNHYRGIVIAAGESYDITGLSAKELLFDNITVNGGHTSMTFLSADNLVGGHDLKVVNSTFTDFYKYAIHGQCTENFICEGSEFMRENRTNSDKNVAIWQFDLFNSTIVKDVKLIRNRVRNTHDKVQINDAYNLDVIDMQLMYDGTKSFLHEFINNVFDHLNAPGDIVVFNLNNTDNMDIYHNTVHIDYNSPYSPATVEVFDMYYCWYFNLQNNISFVKHNSNGQKRMAYAKGVGFDNWKSNVYYFDCPNSNNIIGTNAVDNYTIADWQSDLKSDQGAKYANPIFGNPSLGLFDPANPNVKKIGVNAGVTEDYRGITRTLPNPDPGAFESKLTVNDMGVTAFLDAAINPCVDSIPIIIRISNLGQIDIHDGYVYWEINGVSQTPIYFKKPLFKDKYLDFDLGKIPNSTSVLTTLKAWTSLPNGNIDDDTRNDTLTVTDLKIQGLTGTYTIGVGGDYVTFNAAIAELQTKGVCGPVVFDVLTDASGYNEIFKLGIIKGASAVNHITFEGNGQTLYALPRTSDDRDVISFEGARYITIRNLKIDLTNSLYGNGIRFSARADSNVIDGCEIFMRDDTIAPFWSAVGIHFTARNDDYLDYGVNGRYNNIINNKVNGGYAGIVINGQTSSPVSAKGNLVEGNQVTNFYSYGLYTRYAEDAWIRNNDVSKPTRLGSTSFYGIYIYSTLSKQLDSVLIEGNQIHDPFGAYLPNEVASTFYGIYCYYQTMSATKRAYIQNNLIYNVLNTRGTVYGVYSNQNNTLSIYNNTIEFNVAGIASTTTRGIFVSNSSNPRVYNNIIEIVRGTGTAISGLYFVGGNFTSDYNDVFVPGGNYGTVMSTNYLTLADWQLGTGEGMNSSEADPQFNNAGANDYTPTNAAILDFAAPLSSVKKDIYGNYRSAIAVEPGAIEVGLTKDIGVTAIITPKDGCGLTSSETLTVDVTNFGTSVATGFSIGYEVTGPINSGLITENVGSFSLNPNETKQYTFSSKPNFSTVGAYYLTASTIFGGDEFLGNNGVGDSIHNLSGITANAGSDKSICRFDTVRLGAAPTATGSISGYVYTWSPNFTLKEKDSANPYAFPDVTTIYSLEIRTKEGCIDTDEIEIEVVPGPIVDAGADTGFCGAGAVPIGGNPTATGGKLNYTYKWSSGGSLNADFIANPRASPNDTTYYTSRVTDANGCRGYNVVRVNVAPFPPVVEIFASDTTPCLGDSISLWTNYDPEYEVTWNTGQKGDSIRVKVTKDFRYIGIAENHYSCIGSGYIDITTEKLSVFAGGDELICAGKTVTVGGSPTAFNGSGNYEYVWLPNIDVSNNLIPNPDVNPTVTTVYTIEVLDVVSGCYERDSVKIDLSATKPIVNAGKDRGFCQSSTITLGGNPSATGGGGFYSYNWSPSANVSNPIIANPTLTVQPGVNTYVLEVEDNRGCKALDEITITYLGNPTVSAGPDKEICFGDNVLIGSSNPATGGNGVYTFTWSPVLVSGKTAIDDPTKGNPMANPEITTQFTLHVIDTFGCEATDDMQVAVIPGLNVQAGNDVELCAGVSAALGGAPSAQGGTGIYTYSWQPSNEVPQNTNSNPIVQPSNSIVYTLFVIDSKGCEGQDSVAVNVNPNPIVDAGADQADCKNTNFTLGGYPTATNGTGVYSYAWQPASKLNNATSSNPEFIGDITRTFTVSVLDAKGCSGNDQVTVTVHELPTAFAGPAVVKSCPGVTEILGGNPAAKNGIGPYTYSWYPTIGLSQSHSPNPGALAPQTNFKYTLTVTDANGCIDDAVTTIVHDELVVNAGQDENLCQGRSVIIGGNPVVSNGAAPYSFSWTNKASLSHGNTGNPVASPQVDTRYILSVSDARGCVGEDTVEVKVKSKPIVDAGNNQLSCSNTGIVLGGNPTASGNGGFVYNWEPSAYLNNPAISHPIATVQNNVYFTLRVTDVFGCEAEDVVIINAAPELIIDAGTDKEVCALNSVQIGQNNPIVKASNGPYGYSWAPSQSLNQSNIPNPTAYTLTETWYTLTVQDANGCFASDSMKVFVNPLPLADAGLEVQSMCEQAQIKIGGTPSGIGGTGSLFYNWSPNTNLSNPSDPNPNASPTSKQKYILQVTDAKGCVDFDTTEVVISQNPLVNAGADKVICSGEAVMLGSNPTASIGTAPFSYAWSSPSDLNGASLSNPQASPSQTRTFYLTVVDAVGCEGQDEVTIEVNESPIADAGQNKFICSGEVIVIGGNPTGKNGTGTYQYFWSPSFGLNNKNIANPTASITANQTYEVVVIDQNGCEANDSVEIDVQPTPYADFNVINNGGGKFQFTDLSSSAGGWYWDFGDGLVSSLQNPSHTYAQPGNYNVCLTTSNSGGCEDIKCRNLVVEDNVGVNEISAISVLVYPNPAIDNLIIELDGIGSSQTTIELFDYRGRLVYLHTMEARKEFIDISSYARGVYSLRITQANLVVNRKIILRD